MTENELRNIPLNNHTNDVVELDVQDSLDKGKNKRKWFRYLQVLNQMIGLITVTGNKDFENRQNELFEAIYTNGRAAITFIRGRLQIWTIGGFLKYDINGDLESIELKPYQGIGVNINDSDIESVKMSGKKVVVIKAGSYGFSMWMLWNQILTDNVELMSIYLTNARLNIKKLQWIVNNGQEDITKDELDSIMDPTTPFIKTINPIVKAGKGDIRQVAGEQNTLMELNLSNGDYDIKDVVNHWIFETNLMGLFQDEYHKKERQTSGENEISQANTILIHEVYLREFKKAQVEIKEKFGIDVNFEKTVQLSVEENEKDKGDKKDE